MPPLFEKIDPNFFVDRTSFFLRFFFGASGFYFPDSRLSFPDSRESFPDCRETTFIHSSTVGKRHLSTVRLSGNHSRLSGKIPDCRENISQKNKK